MASLALPDIQTLPSLPATTQTAVLDALFEPSPSIHGLLLPLLQSTTFPSYSSLISAVYEKLSALAASKDPKDEEVLLGVLGSHPRLGARKVESAQSRAEQAKLQASSEEEGRLLRELNEEYERVFPGLIYVVFVNGRSRPVIMEDMKRRIARGDIEEEKREAIKAMCDIAKDRAGKLQSQL